MLHQISASSETLNSKESHTELAQIAPDYVLVAVDTLFLCVYTVRYLKVICVPDYRPAIFALCGKSKQLPLFLSIII